MYSRFHKIKENARSSSVYLPKSTELSQQTCPLANPTDRSAMRLSSVSPLRWLTITPQPAALESNAALMDPVTVPIWLSGKSINQD